MNKYEITIAETRDGADNYNYQRFVLNANETSFNKESLDKVKMIVATDEFVEGYELLLARSKVDESLNTVVEQFKPFYETILSKTKKVKKTHLADYML